MVRATRFLAFALCAIALAAGLSGRTFGATQSQRSQIGIGVVINVTPAPVSMAIRRAHGAQAVPAPLRVTSVAHAVRPGEKHRVPSFRLSDGSLIIAQTQGNIAVKANVSPAPNATLLTSNMTSVTINGTAGQSTTLACAFTVAVDTTARTWTLDTALASDFIDKTTFPGGDLSWAMYSSPGPSPRPSPEATTAYVVYPDNNNVAGVAVASSASQIYCVDLTIFIPTTVAGGSYSTTAIYTLFY
jgi:hypothetical protein